jgi:hypothetical protein
MRAQFQEEVSDMSAEKYFGEMFAFLEASMDYLREVMVFQLKKYFNKGTSLASWEDIPFVDLDQFSQNPFINFIKYFQFSQAEINLVLIALAPHIKSDFYDTLIQTQLPEAGDFPQLGGLRGKQYRGFLPTGETALFILGGNSMLRRFSILQLLDTQSFLVKNKIVWVDEPLAGEPAMSGQLILDKDYVELFTTGKISIPRRTVNFPAEYLSTNLQWEDLVLPPNTWNQINEIENWINHHPTLMFKWGMVDKLKPGYRALFYGPPGTGKTFTASLLGKYTQRPVFKIDLSMVVSKFIGETEKNLASLFDKAQNKDWILFFDEADAIFGKRTNVRDAHDKYANQEVSYLLQRIESYSGLVILASNFKGNIDEAFTRRFQSFVHFPLPQPKERLQLWQKGFPEQVKFEPDVDFPSIAKEFDLSGSNIINIIQYCCLSLIAKNKKELSLNLLMKAIKREYLKEGKSI